MGKNILVIGGNRGIGEGFVHQLMSRSDVESLFVTYRCRETAQNLFNLVDLYPQKIIPLEVDVTQEGAIASSSKTIQSHVDKLHLVINCVGILHEENLFPEKSLKHINSDNLLRYFQVNTIPTALWAKHLIPLFKHSEKTIFAIISAKVGSIEDNRLGGWYGYRTSKAALNMLIKNIAIEYNRIVKNTTVVALHPGTTDTNLSQPFQANVSPEKLFSVERCTQQLLSIINHLTPENNGQFVNWDGNILPW